MMGSCPTPMKKSSIGTDDLSLDEAWEEVTTMGASNGGLAKTASQCEQLVVAHNCISGVRT
jgi:hypothetical protein